MRAHPDVLVYVGVDLVGDGLIKLPFIQALRGAYPSGTITWLAGRGPSVFGSVLAPLVVGLLDEVVDHPGQQHKMAWRERPSLRKRKFDIIFDTQRGVLTTLALRRMRPGLFLSGSANFLLSDRRPTRNHARPLAVVQQLLQLLELATGQSQTTQPALRLDAAMTDLAERLLPRGPAYVAIAPGAGGRNKIWPVANFIDVAQSLASSGYVPVWLLGPDELPLYEQLRSVPCSAQFPLQNPAVMAYGFRPDLTIAVAAQCLAGLANDSGCGHMMAVSDIPVVRLFGPTDPAKFAHSSKRSIVISALDWGTDSMNSIPVEAVLGVLTRTLADRANVPA